jgi:hypothetical protein
MTQLIDQTQILRNVKQESLLTDTAVLQFRKHRSDGLELLRVPSASSADALTPIGSNSRILTQKRNLHNKVKIENPQGS